MVNIFRLNIHNCLTDHKRKISVCTASATQRILMVLLIIILIIYYVIRELAMQGFH